MRIAVVVLALFLPPRPVRYLNNPYCRLLIQRDLDSAARKTGGEESWCGTRNHQHQQQLDQLSLHAQILGSAHDLRHAHDDDDIKFIVFRSYRTYMYVVPPSVLVYMYCTSNTAPSPVILLEKLVLNLLPKALT